MSTQKYVASANEIHWLDPETIEDSPFQPSTRVLTPEKQREFDASVETHGVLQEGLVRPVKGKKHKGIEYQCVFGHLRRDACRRLGQQFPAKIRPMSDTEAALLTLAENVDREAVTATQEAETIAKIMQKAEENGEPSSVRAIARLMGKSPTYISTSLAILKVKPDVRAVADANPNVKSSCLEIDKISDKDERAPLLAAVEKGASYREIKPRVDAVLEKEKQQRSGSSAPDKQTQSRAVAHRQSGGGQMSRGRQMRGASRSEANQKVRAIGGEVVSALVVLAQWWPYAAPAEKEKVTHEIEAQLKALK